MNSKDQRDPLDNKLDELLLSSPVEAADDFTERTLALLHASRSEVRLDAAVEKLLSGKPLQASRHFTSKTLRRLRRDAMPSKKRTVISFPILTRWIGAAAAVLVLGFFTVQSILPPLGDSTRRNEAQSLVSLVEKEPVPIDAEPANGLAFAEATPNTGMTTLGPQQFSDEHLPDLLVAELFMLSDSLSETALSLDDGVFDTLAFLTTQ